MGFLSSVWKEERRRVPFFFSFFFRFGGDNGVDHDCGRRVNADGLVLWNWTGGGTDEEDREH